MTPVTMRALDVPYGLSESKADQVFKVGSTLQVEAGAELRFEANCGLEVAPTGALTILGTSTRRVLLTGRSATPGFWKGVAVVSMGNALINTDLRFGGGAEFCCGYFEPVAGSPSTRAALVVGDSSTQGGITLTDVTVTQSAHRGLARLNGAVTLAGTNDLLTGNGQPNLP